MPEMIVNHRLINQQIAETEFKKPEEIVSWLGAMQAQEWAHAKWAIGLRLPAMTDRKVEMAFNNGDILRTHLLRPTWHFVTPADIRWLLNLTAPRVHANNAFMYRKTELDTKLLNRCCDIIGKAFRKNEFLRRTHLQQVLQQKKILAEGHRLSYIMMYAELEAIICSGPRQGKQFTYALLDDRVPAVKALSRTEALYELTRRYFLSRGPATLKDYVTWSGLTIKDAKAGMAAVSSEFKEAQIDGVIYLMPDNQPKDISGLQTTFLMPDYDEYGMGYKDRTAIFDQSKEKLLPRAGNPVFNHNIVVDGIIKGTWSKTPKETIETVLFHPLGKTKQKAVEKAITRYQNFTADKE